MHIKYLSQISLLTVLLLSGCGSSDPTSTVDDIDTPDPTPIDSNATLVAENEPYYKYSWHINAKDSVLNSSGFPINQNADINITEAWKLTKGAGIKVAVIDDAFDVNHEDLNANISNTYNADDDSSDVSNKNPIDDEYGTSHGHTCAGFIVAPINGKGIVAKI